MAMVSLGIPFILAQSASYGFPREGTEVFVCATQKWHPDPP